MPNLINGVDLSLFNFTLEDPSGYLDAPPLDNVFVHVVRKLGGRSRSERLNERPFQINGYVKGSTNAAAKTNLNLLKALALRGMRGVLEVYLEDRASYYARLKYGSFRAIPHGPANVATKWGVEMGFTAADPPTWISSALTTISNISTTPVAIPMGTANPYSPVLAIYEPDDPVITLRDHNDVTLGTPMGFTMTHSAGEYLVIDIGRGEIYRNTSGLPGTGTESSCDWTAGDMLEFDFHNWDPFTGTWMDIAISDGTGVLTFYPCDF